MVSRWMYHSPAARTSTRPAVSAVGMAGQAKKPETIQAAITGDYGRALQAFMSNPLIKKGKAAQELLDEMLVANKKYLPQFADKIRELEGEA